MNLFDLTGKVAVVTGGSSGIGFGMAKGMGQAGATIAIAYLPDGLRFGTLTGPVADPGVTDWRDGVERLEATSAPRDLQPLVDAMKPGQRLALVVPEITSVNRWRAPWTSLVRLRTEEWLQTLSNDPSLSLVSVEPVDPFPLSPYPVRAQVYLKR